MRTKDCIENCLKSLQDEKAFNLWVFVKNY